LRTLRLRTRHHTLLRCRCIRRTT